MKIFHNYKDISGLLFVSDLFDEVMEKELFNCNIFSSIPPSSMGRTCYVNYLPETYPECIKKLIKLIKTSIYPELIYPNSVLGINYEPINGQFMAHFDGRFKWGESIVGVNLGRGCYMYFTKDKTVTEVYMPPRSIYILNGSSRYDYKHGIRKFTAERMKTMEISKWNKSGCRRSLTLRSLKIYSDMMLEYLYNNSSTEEDKKKFDERIKDQNKYPPKDDSGKKIPKDMNNEIFQHCYHNLEYIISNIL
jgi:hypothetical protein